MTTVTAKDLRANLSGYLDRLQAGEEIAIIRHSHIIGSLKPADTDDSKHTGAAFAAFMKDNRHMFKFIPGVSDSPLSTKELYHQLLDEQYGVK